MSSLTREIIWSTMEDYSYELQLLGARILDIGIAGDKARPSDRAKYFEGNDFKTMDADPKWGADYTCDITNMQFPDNSFDLIICGQVLEHVFDFQKALKEIYRVSRKYAIIDTPFFYPEHPEPPSFGDYWRFTSQGMQLLLEQAGFKKVKVRNLDDLLITALAEK